jgi:hypothetical protein
MTTTGLDPLEQLDSAAQVMEFVRTRQAVEERADRDVFLGVIAWAEQHPPESIVDAARMQVANFSGPMDTEVPLAGEGAPLVAEFCIAELAAGLGRTTYWGREIVADGLEVKYRLPRLFARVCNAGEPVAKPSGLPVWQARRIAARTRALTQEAAAWVDRQVAAYAHKVGPAQLERLVEEAIARFMPEVAKRQRDESADQRKFDVHHDNVTFNGTSRIDGELDLADALDLDAALQREAENLKAAGCEAGLDARRAMAAGHIARRQLALDLAAARDDEKDIDEGVEPSASAPTTRKGAKPRQVVLHVHISEQALRSHGRGGADFHLARVENHNQGVTADQVRDWCANPDTVVTVKPVLDVDQRVHVGAYEIPDRLHDQAAERDFTCVFPWCNLPARRCDTDHVIAHADGGPTATDNLAPLCRSHHRLKTRSPWGYTVLEPGSYLWTSPHGYQYLRDHTGTLDVSADRRYRAQHPPDH